MSSSRSAVYSEVEGVVVPSTDVLPWLAEEAHQALSPSLLSNKWINVLRSVRLSIQ